MAIDLPELPSGTVAAGLKALEPIFRHAIRIYRERQAGQTPFAGQNVIAAHFDETLARIVSGRLNDAWWRNLLNAIEQPLVSPECLRKPSLQEWLSKASVQDDLKAEARARLLGVNKLDPNRAERLSQAYSDATFDRAEFAFLPIELVVGILVAGYLASIPQPLQGIAGMIQGAALDTSEGIARVEGKLDAMLEKSDESFVRAAHGREVKQRLDVLRKCRAFNSNSVRDALRLLLHDVSRGELRYVEQGVRSDVLYWFARVSSAAKSTAEDAREALAQLHTEAPGMDLRIPEALVHEHEDNADAAIALLAGIDTADGRSTYLVALRRLRGLSIADAWYTAEAKTKDVPFLTELGWYNVAVCLCELGRWEEAASVLERLVPEWANWPDLAFLDGVVNTALLLPTDLRPHVLRMDVFHPAIRPRRGIDVPEIRARALASFQRAVELFGQLGELAELRKLVAADWILWLGLADHDEEIAKGTVEEIQRRMKNAKDAIRLLPFAYGFGFPIDTEPLRRYLALRAQIGGLQPEELRAEVMLAEMELSPEAFAELLEKAGSKFDDVFPKEFLLGKRIEAFVRAGQSARGMDLLSANEGLFADRDPERLRALIDAHAGKDPRTTLERIYKETGNLLDAKNLVRHLTEVRDWPAVRPLAERLFTLERNPENAARLLRCYKNLPAAGAKETIRFLESEPDVEDWSPNFVAEHAWALFEVGEVRDARGLLNKLLVSRRHANDTQLDINIAIQSGEWERLSAIVNREWEHREDLEPTVLLQLAQIAAESDPMPLRSLELAKIAVAKAPKDPKTLMSAYSLATQLGKEDSVDPQWVATAAELSSESGPVQHVDLRTFVEEIAPASRKQNLEVNNMLVRGEIPLQFAAHTFGMPLSRMLIDLPCRNQELADGRGLIVIPAFSGERALATIPVAVRLGVDVTTLLVLEWLGLLREALSSFEQVILPSSTMIWLLNERRRVRFHQLLMSIQN